MRYFSKSVFIVICLDQLTVCGAAHSLGTCTAINEEWSCSVKSTKFDNVFLINRMKYSTLLTFTSVFYILISISIILLLTANYYSYTLYTFEPRTTWSIPPTPVRLGMQYVFKCRELISCTMRIKHVYTVGLWNYSVIARPTQSRPPRHNRRPVLFSKFFIHHDYKCSHWQRKVGVQMYRGMNT